MTLEIRETDSEHELIAVGRLRYAVTVQEMKLDMRYANHRTKTVIEPLDHSGHVFAAWCNGSLVGTARQNFVREDGGGEYFESYAIAALPGGSCDNVSVTSRLVVVESHRHRRVSLLLPATAYDFLLQNEITCDVIDSRPKLLPYFSRLEYRTHLESWGHPEFGDVVVQYLAVDDEPHLTRVGSPFLRRLIAHRSLQETSLESRG